MYLHISLTKPSSFGASNTRCTSFTSELTTSVKQSCGWDPECRNQLIQNGIFGT